MNEPLSTSKSSQARVSRGGPSGVLAENGSGLNPKEVESPRRPSLEKRIDTGRELRHHAPRSSHDALGNVERDPVVLLQENSSGRMEQLVPLRYGRMLASPFAFFRGSAALQAHDLAATPCSGLSVQLCGDAHLMNFGGFATPERNLAFDINDFDETHPGPWEWDVKRLAASVMVAARHLGFKQGVCDEVVYDVVDRYRLKMAACAEMGALELWYDKLTFDDMLRHAKFEQSKKEIAKLMEKASRRTHEQLLPKLAREVAGKWIMRDAPPELFHVGKDNTVVSADDPWVTSGQWLTYVKPAYDDYRSTLNPSHAHLLSNFEPHDVAFKVVGVGSVGTLCGVILLVDAQRQPLFLQFKQASRSVVAPYVPEKSAFEHEGQRVVAGQRLMQSASDIFLGWATGPKGNHFFFRQLRDMKVSFDLELLDEFLFGRYASLCGDVLARAHARASGLAPEVRGYLGKNGAFSAALVAYANAYADQVERDFSAFRKACRTGRLSANTDTDYAADVSL